MPAPRAVIRDIHDLNLDPKKPHRVDAETYRLKSVNKEEAVVTKEIHKQIKVDVVEEQAAVLEVQKENEPEQLKEESFKPIDKKTNRQKKAKDQQAV